MSAANGATHFPVADRLTLAADRSVDHSSYWSSPYVLAQLGTWLELDSPAVCAEPSPGRPTR